MVIYVVPYSGITGQYCLVVLTGYTIGNTIALLKIGFENIISSALIHQVKT